MNRVELKENAKRMIIGNKWYLWKPMVMFEIVMFCIGFIVGLICVFAKLDKGTMNIVTSIVGSLGAVIETVFLIGYAKYCLEFVRGNKMEWKEPIKFGLSHLSLFFVVSLLA